MWGRRSGYDTFVDGSIIPQAYGCDLNPPDPKPEQCDGLGSSSIPVDQGCQGDEHGCHIGDGDTAPIRYSSGRVESNPIELFRVPTPGDILFGYRIIYNSQVNRMAARREIVNGIRDEQPVIHHSQEDTHYVGLGWLDNFSDRLQVTALNTPSTQITWTSQNGTVTFTKNGSEWKSWSGKFELIDRGASPPDGFGRWVVRSVDSSAPRQIWSFEEFTYRRYDGSADKTLGRLRRRALLTSNLSDLIGRYGFTITWSSRGTIISAIDTLGRQLDFNYIDKTECVELIPNESPPNNCARLEIISSRLSAVQYKPSSEATASTIAKLQMESSTNHDRLERVERPALAGYTRFLYRAIPSDNTCTNCSALLTDVIIPGDAATSTPAVSAAVLPTEIVLEHDDYGPSPAQFTMVGIHSKAPGREYAYEYTATKTTQFDLHQDGGPCGAGNTCTAPGFACRTQNQLAPRCYAADVILHSANTGLPTSHATFSSGGAPSGSGNARTYARNYTSTGAPRDVTDASGSRTTYGYDSSARLRCIVRNDNDTRAFANPAQPDSSACAGPTAGRTVQVDYGATTTTTTTLSAFGGNVTQLVVQDPVLLLPTSRTLTGSTRDLDGAVHSETQRSTTMYDSLGRAVEENGPLDDVVAYDATTTNYYNSYDPLMPFNYGQIREVKKYVGTTTSHIALTTHYAEYDLLGVPHRVVEPNGVQTIYNPSPDRLIWTATVQGSDNVHIGTSTVTFNTDGTVRSEQAADGVCMTYEYTGASTFVGVPTVVRRSNTDCGIIPIDRNSGEVEIRTYVNDEPDRLESIVRKRDGTTTLTLSGFTYDRDRRLIFRATLDSPTPFTYSFTDVLPSGAAAPDGPAPGSWKTSISADAFGRPNLLARFIDPVNRQTYQYSYAAGTSLRPTAVTRGYNGASTSVSTFVYDDFARLLEARVPEAGPPGVSAPTRYEYDVGNRLTKARVGIGTPNVNTSVYSRDSIGRVTSIDRDTEHPVDCEAMATPSGTPIDDTEYTYDRCSATDVPADFDCANGLGRLTVSRAIIQCGSNQDIVKRGRWYSYDAAGRIHQVAHATVAGATIGAPAIMSHSYDAVGRTLSYTSPLNDAFGTSYTYRPEDGRVGTVSTTGGDTMAIATNITYEPFGRLRAMTTASGQPVAGGTRTLTMRNTYRQDGEIEGISSSFEADGSLISLDLVNQHLAYTPAGMLRDRSDSADSMSTRYYGYDALQRLTCEVRSGSSSDCTIASPLLAGLFTYGDGQGPTMPGDARLSAFINAAGSGGASYTSPSIESYAYAGGSSQPQVVAGSGTNIALIYDAIGRRVSDSQAGSPTSRRDYTYLPSGQLATIQGISPGGESYAFSIRYDAEGRPITIEDLSGQNYELFWDDTDRLIAASITGRKTVRWHYHYLDRRLIAATREVTEATTSVKRFWSVTDERGLIYRMVDDVGATYWQSRWDATAWRSPVGVAQPDMWVPFGLQGQIILEGTESYGNAGGMRPAIALNQMRAYDPFVGGFLQPDPADQEIRLLAEGYLYGRGDYIGNVDPTGASTFENIRKYVRDSWALRIDDSCAYPVAGTTLKKILGNQEMIAIMIQQIENCMTGKCGDFPGGPNIKRRWEHALLVGRYACATKEAPYDSMRGWWYHVDADSGRLVIGDGTINGTTASAATEVGRTLADRLVVFSEQATDCWARDIAHEALHAVFPGGSHRDVDPLQECISCVPWVR